MFTVMEIQMFQYLHAWTVSFAADQSCRDVSVSELIVQVDHVRHPAWQEELVPLHLACSEHHTVDIPTWGGRQKEGLMFFYYYSFDSSTLKL